VTVLGADGTGQDSDIIAGVVYAADHGANVILMAFSNPSYSTALQAAIDYAWSKGAVLVAATGNDASSAPSYPAGDRGVVGVSATDQNDALSSFSNYGTDTFIAAPGVGIETTNAGGGYGSIDGTSASAAEVAGAAALLRANDPSLPADVVIGRLARSADLAGTFDQTGNGRLNLGRAITNTSTEPVVPVGAPGGGPFVGPYVIAARQLTLTFAGTGGGSVTITVPSGDTVNAPTSCGGTGTFATSQTVSGTCSSNISLSNNSATGTISAAANSSSFFAGWSTPNNFTGCTGTSSPCSFSITGSSPALTATFTLRNSTSTTASAASATYATRPSPSRPR
jgi:Subtilase family